MQNIINMIKLCKSIQAEIVSIQSVYRRNYRIERLLLDKSGYNDCYELEAIKICQYLQQDINMLKFTTGDIYTSCMTDLSEICSNTETFDILKNISDELNYKEYYPYSSYFNYPFYTMRMLPTDWDTL